jgi:hypothetical protein
MLFTRVAPHTKSKGLLIGGPLFSKKTYAFYTRSIVYKKQGAPDRWSTSSITFSTRFVVYKKQGAPDRWSTHLLLLSARASPHTKSKGLHRCVLQIYYFINQVSKNFADQRVSSSLSMIQIISHQIPISGSIYF